MNKTRKKKGTTPAAAKKNDFMTTETPPVRPHGFSRYGHIGVVKRFGGGITLVEEHTWHLSPRAHKILLMRPKPQA